MFVRQKKGVWRDQTHFEQLGTCNNPSDSSESFFKNLYVLNFWKGEKLVNFAEVGKYIDAVTSSGILKAKQKLGVTFNFDKQDVIDLTKFSKMTMCRASEANSEK